MLSRSQNMLICPISVFNQHNQRNLRSILFVFLRLFWIAHFCVPIRVNSRSFVAKNICTL